MKARLYWLSFLAVLFALAPAAPAQDGTLTLTAAIEPATAKPGDKLMLVLTANVTPGWHAYGTLEKTNIPIALPADGLKLGGLALDGAAQIPPGERKTEPMEQFPLPNRFTVKQPLKVPAGLAGGEVTVTGALDYQICDASMCLPPDQAQFSVKVTIDAPAAAPRTETKPGLQLVPDEKVTIKAKFEPATVRAGEVSTLVLTVEVHDKEFHAYGARETTNKPVRLDPAKVDAGVLELAGEAQVPPGELKMLGSLEQYPLPHVFEVKQVFKVPSGTKPTTVDVSGALDYQLCTSSYCEEATTIDFEAKLVVEAGEARAEAMKVPEPPKAPDAKPVDDGNPFGGGWLALILACIGGGLFALAMPCTYPMIPITFSFFTKQAEKRGGNVLSLAIVYGLGIVLMFTVVGALLSSVIIDVVNHWATNVVIGSMFVFFAFVLFGWINLSPPQFLTNAAGKASATGGYLGVFFMGATLVITSFTCTAPIVGSLLANVAQFGTTRVAIGMAIFGATMALPFVVLSLMPGKVKAMPRSGEWMETLKISLGFVELAAALKFASMVDFAFGWQALPRELFLLLWTAIFGLWALYLFGMLRKAGSGPNEGVGAGRMASGMFVTMLATYFLFGAMGNKLDKVMTGFIPGYSNSLLSKGDAAHGKKHRGDHEVVFDDRKRAIEVAKADDKLLLYNFTGFN